MKSWLFGLRPIASSNRIRQKLIAFGGAQWRAQIRGVILTKAHIEGAGAGQAYTVAAFAEIMGERRNETETTRPFP